MEKDCRVELVRAVQERILPALGAEAAELAAAVLTVEMEKYDITERCTALIPYNDENQKTLKRYLACLLIDGKSATTIESYRRTIIKMTECLHKNYAEIGAYDLRLFLAYEKSRGVSNSTLENTRANLSAFFQWLTVEEIIDKNPCLSIKPIKCQEKKRLPLTSVELDMLRMATKDARERAMIELLVSSGIRVSELVNLDVSDVDLPQLTVRVRNGKGGKDRTTYINEVTRTHMSRYLREKGITSGPLFLGAKSKTRISAGGVRNVLKTIAERAGVENVHPHRFRRTFATGLASRGMPVQEIMRLLGHTNINTTMTYVAMCDDQIQMAYKQYTA